MSNREDMEKFIDEVRARQRNIVFPDTVRNGRAVDVFLWRGSPNPTLAQRIVAWIFGIVFLAAGLSTLALAVAIHDHDSLITWIPAVPFLYLGIRIFRNGFPRHD